jgi:hypothetical protein
MNGGFPASCRAVFSRSHLSANVRAAQSFARSTMRPSADLSSGVADSSRCTWTLASSSSSGSGVSITKSRKPCAVSSSFCNLLYSHSLVSKPAEQKRGRQRREARMSRGGALLPPCLRLDVSPFFNSTTIGSFCL